MFIPILTLFIILYYLVNRYKSLLLKTTGKEYYLFRTYKVNSHLGCWGIPTAALKWSSLQSFFLYTIYILYFLLVIFNKKLQKGQFQLEPYYKTLRLRPGGFFKISELQNYKKIKKARQHVYFLKKVLKNLYIICISMN